MNRSLNTASNPLQLSPLFGVIGITILSLIVYLLPIGDSFLIICLASIAIASLYTPLSALAVVLIIAPLRTLFLTESKVSLPLEIGQLTVIFFALSWFIYVRNRHQPLFVVPKHGTFALIPLIFVLSVFGLSLFYGWSIGSSITEWLKWIFLAMFALLTYMMASPQRVRWISIILVASALANALIGIYIFLGGSGATHLLIENRFFRAFGTFGQPNPFGGFMGMVAPIALVLAFSSFQRFLHTRKKHLFLQTMLFFGVFCVLQIALIFSWSRGAWLAMGLSLFAILFAIPRKLTHSLAISVGFILIVSILWYGNILPQSIKFRIESSAQEFLVFSDIRGIDITTENYAVVERLAHWQAALAMAQDNPFGVGIGNYEIAYEKYRLFYWIYPLGHAHNFYLNILAEAGIIGLVSYGILLVTNLFFLWKAREHPDATHRWLAIGILGSWIYIIFHSLLDNLYVNNAFIHIGVILGMTYYLYYQTTTVIRMR